MTSDRNSWGVEYSRIAWLEGMLGGHKNVAGLSRHDDIVFEITRVAQKDVLTLLCCDEYTCGITTVQKALAEFGALNVIHVGGVWNAYTRVAKEFCIKQEIGLFNSGEFNGALWQNDYWTYHRKDDDGNPVYPYRAA